MPCLLPLFLLCLLLLTAACKKDAAEPEPELEGRWNDALETYLYYKPDGKLFERTSHSQKNTVYRVYTSDVIFYYNVADDTPVNAPSNYKRVGNELYEHPNGYSIGMITNLTKDTLILRHTKWYTYPDYSGNYIDLEQLLTR